MTAGDDPHTSTIREVVSGDDGVSVESQPGWNVVFIHFDEFHVVCTRGDAVRLSRKLITVAVRRRVRWWRSTTRNRTGGG